MCLIILNPYVIAYGFNNLLIVYWTQIVIELILNRTCFIKIINN